MSQLVYYSLFMPSWESRTDLLQQLLSSVQTLREYNRTVPAVLFIHGDPPAELASALAPYDIRIFLQGAYEARLAQLCPSGWQVLAHYPVLHKFLNFAEISTLSPRQVLYLDCDTLFFDDVSRLFHHYEDADCYAREEPTCRRSHYGYDCQYIDEEALARLAMLQGVRPLPPFNLGVVLFNHEIWNTLAGLDRTLVSYVWRLLIWLALNSSETRTILYGESTVVRLLRQQFEGGVALKDARDALLFPSANEWILEQVAFWLTLGQVSDLTYADFNSKHVLQNGELLSQSNRQPDWILCHYFSQNMSRVENWLRESPPLTSP